MTSIIKEQLIYFLFQWFLPMAIMLGLYMVFIDFLYKKYEKLDVDRIWKFLVKAGIVAGIIVAVWIGITSSQWFKEVAGYTKIGTEWVKNTEQAQAISAVSNEWWQKVLQFIMVWIPPYFRAFVIVWVLSTVIFIQSLIWRIQFTRAINIILSSIVLFPFLTMKYLVGYQTPFFDYIYSKLFVAKLKENINDSYFETLYEKENKKFESGAGGSVQKQKVKATAIAIKRTKSKVKTNGGIRRAELVIVNSREVDTDRLIENALKGFGQRVIAPSIRFQEEPVLNVARGGYVFDSEVFYNSGDALGTWKSIFINPFAEEKQVKNGGEGAIHSIFSIYSEIAKYISHFTPPAIYERTKARENRLYVPDRTAEKAKFKAQQNLDLSVIPKPVDEDTGNDIDKQTEIAKKVAINRIPDVTNALNAFRISGTFDKVLVGGNTAIYQYTLARTADLPNDFKKIQEGIANMLKTPEIPIIGISAGILTVSLVNGVNIPVDFTKMIRTRKKGMKSIITGIAGVDALGNNIYVELGDTIPHMMLFGATGQGKTVTMMTILYSVMSAVDPTMLKIAYIDGKGNSFEFMRTDNKGSENYHPNPFTYAQPADASGDIEYTRALIKHFVLETRRRIELFKQRGVSKLAVFNQKFPDEALYEILVICDEFSAITDLDSQLKSSELGELGTIENFEYLAKMARSVGIRLILGNQTARKEKVPGKISANIGGRLSLGVSEPIESDIALPDSNIPVHLIKQAGEFYSTMNGIRNAEHGNSPYLSDDVMNSLNDSLEEKFGHHDYIISRDEVMKEVYGESEEQTKLYDIPDPLPTLETKLEDLLYIVDKYPEWAIANEESHIFTRNKFLNVDSPSERRANKAMLNDKLNNIKGIKKRKTL
ncbi:FtsK/SpoIIIE domain-containing protein [Enterococcus faecalis]